jgi:hypothetical protein
MGRLYENSGRKAKGGEAEIRGNEGEVGKRGEE